MILHVDTEAAASRPHLFPYVYRWGPRMPGAMDRKGKTCRVLARSKKGFNSALVEFEDGYLAVVSRNALALVRHV